jgi:hypothetical protein
MEILKVVLLAIGLMAIGMAGMAVRILIKKGGKFPNTHVSGNKYLKSQGVYCSQTQDRLEQRKAYKKVDFNRVIILPDQEAGK